MDDPDTFSRQADRSFLSGLRRQVQRNLSLITIFFVFISVCSYNIRNKDWDNPARLIKDDVHYYYFYAVSAIVYNDLKMSRVYSKLPAEIKRELWLPVHEETGRFYSKMSMGLSLVYAPFTAFSHYVLVPLTGAEPDGYSPPYRIGLLLSAMVFLMLGLWHLRKLLLEYFSEAITTTTLLIITFGTNLTWYMTSEATMSHVYSFALVIVMCRLLMKWFSSPSFGLSLLLGLVFGLIVLIRPTNIIFLCLFFATDRFTDRIRFLFSNYAKIVLMIAAFLLIWAPQFLFWKTVGGSWFLYTYGDEHFFWGNPQVSGSLFSFRKGWLLYTPLMLMNFIGLFFLWKKYKPVFWQVFTVTILLTYINSSWWCWWFGGSYGNRAYIDGYGVFALAVGALLSYTATKNKLIVSIAGSVVISLFIGLNLFQTWQYREGLIHYVSNTRQSYTLNFLKTKPHPDYFNSLVMPDHASGKLGIYYPVSEITEGRKDQMSSIIARNKEYLISYWIGKEVEKEPLKRSVSPSEKEAIIDSLYRDQAISRYIQMKKRYQ